MEALKGSFGNKYKALLDQKAEKERKEWADEMDRMEAQFKETMSMANRSPVTYSPEFHKQMDELAKAIAEDIKNGKEA